jgi:aminoglycoside phosphotransferase (APT) family kinase protein
MSSISLRTVHQPGLHWENDLFGEVPKWTEEPSIDIMKKLIIQHLELDNEPELRFFAAGALNKLYAFQCAKGSYLMRVVLPVAPGVKTESEVATLNFIREITSIPVPRVVASDHSL